jgi:hypothetical protein
MPNFGRRETPPVARRGSDGALTGRYRYNQGLARSPVADIAAEEKERFCQAKGRMQAVIVCTRGVQPSLTIL